MWMIVGSQEPNKLGDHDQRTGCGLGQSQTVEHLSGFDPAVVFDRLLGDISQHGIGPKVTIAALLKKSPSWTKMSSQPLKKPSTTIGANQRTTQTRITLRDRRQLSRVCSGGASSSEITVCDASAGTELLEAVFFRANLVGQTVLPENRATPPKAR